MESATREITLSGGRKAVIKKLTARELIQVVSFAGSDPSGAVIDLISAVCAITQLEGEAVTPLNARAQFLTLADRLQAEDTILIGMAQKAMSMSEVTDDQKNELDRLAEEISASS